MITKLIEKLKDLHDDPELDMLCTFDGECRQTIKEAADAIEELSAKLQVANMERSSQYYNGGWIPCSERLPEKRGFYLVSTTDCITIMEFINGWISQNIGLCNGYVKAWMPLPQAYKAEGEE